MDLEKREYGMEEAGEEGREPGDSGRNPDCREKLHFMWGCSSAGRAPALQAGGQEFDSPHLHHTVDGERGREYS